MATISREEYFQLYGPTTGDKVFLGTYPFVVEIEKDFTIHGEETVPGLIGTVRQGMAQSDLPPSHPGVADVVIANVVIIDHWGIVKADIGIKNGHISAIGKSGNPDIQKGVDHGLIIGPGTAVYNGAGMYATAGTVDVLMTNVHSAALSSALASGTTTVVGHCTGMTSSYGGTFPYGGTNGIKDTLQAIDSSVVNVALLAQGCTALQEPLKESLEAGAAGFCLPPGRGITPAAIDNALNVAENQDVPVAIGSDCLNEGGFVEDTIAALKGRTAILMDPGGFMGGHADGIRMLGQSNVLGLSTAVTRTLYSAESFTGEDLWQMAFQIHGTKETGNTNVGTLMAELLPITKSISEPEWDDEEEQWVERVIIGGVTVAEDILFYTSRIPMIGSGPSQLYGMDSAASAAWKTISVLKIRLGPHPERDSDLIRRTIATYTINPARAFGIADYVGSLEPGKRADIVLWAFDRFGDQPDAVFSGGSLAYSALAQLGTGDQLPYVPATSEANGLRFVSNAATSNNIGQKYGLSSQLVAVKNTRGLRQEHFGINVPPQIEIDSISQEIRINGVKVHPHKIVHKFRWDFDFALLPQDIIINAGAEEISLRVTNIDDRPIYIGSHYHFYEVNPALEFDREKTRGYRLNIPAGTVLRFAAGEYANVSLVPFSEGRKNKQES